MRLIINRDQCKVITLLISLMWSAISAMEAPKCIYTYATRRLVTNTTMFFDSKKQDHLWVLRYNNDQEYITLLAPKEKSIKKGLIFDDFCRSNGIKEDKAGNIVRVRLGEFQTIDKGPNIVKRIPANFSSDRSVLAITPDVRYVMARWKGKLGKINLATGKLEHTFFLDASKLFHLALGNKEKMIAVMANRVDEYTLNELLVHSFAKANHKICCAEYCLESNNRILGTYDNSLEIYDEDNQFIKRMSTECVPLVIKCCFDGEYIGFTDRQNNAYMRNVQQQHNGSLVLKTGNNYCWSIDWSPSNLIVVGMLDGVAFFDFSPQITKDKAMSSIARNLLHAVAIRKFLDLEILLKS